MVRYTEEDLRKACGEAINTRRLRVAAATWNIPPSTLYGRLHGSLPRSVAHQDEQRLSQPQEAKLADWVRLQQALGLPPTHAQIRELARRILVQRGDTKPLGERWCRAFIARNPVLKTQRAKPIDLKRVHAATEATIRPWFDHFRIPSILKIKPENRWNKDEAGIMEGRGTNGLVIRASDQKAIQKKDPGGRIWTTFVEYMSATSRFLPPLVIFKGKTVQQQWFPRNLRPFKD